MRKVSRGLIGYLAMIAAFILLIVLLSGGVNTVDRRIEYPQLLKYIDEGKVEDNGKYLFKYGLCLPSDNKMTPEQQDRIIDIIHRCFR